VLSIIKKSYSFGRQFRFTLSAVPAAQTPIEFARSMGVFFFGEGEIKRRNKMWPTKAQIFNSVTRFEKKKRKLDLGDLLLTFFTGWLVGILTAIYLFQKV